MSYESLCQGDKYQKMFDTHAHLNFSRFKNNLNEVIRVAKNCDVNQIIIPGTDFETSEKALKIAEENKDMYAAVGIHPHHLFKFKVPAPDGERNAKFKIENEIKLIEKLLINNKVVAVGEVGVDRHIYEQTKYENYTINNNFMDLQKDLLKLQIELAIKYKKSLILHNREAKSDLLDVLNNIFVPDLEGRTVFHCCEPDDDLLKYAINHDIYIGVDGDITYDKQKQEFVKKVPLEILVLETDSPYLLPEPLRSQKLYLPAGRQGPNEPKNLPLIGEFIADLKNISTKKLIEKTTENAKKLFSI